MEDTTQPVQVPETPAQNQPLQKRSGNNQKGTVLIVLGAIIVLLIVAGLFYFSTRQTNQSTPQPTTTVQATPTSKPNLNPNTGDLYQDIKIRMNQVLK